MDSSALVIVIGIVGSVASIIGLLIAAPGIKSKVIHVVYALAITAVASTAVAYHNQMDAARREIEEIHRIEREAQAILDSSDRSTEGSMIGLMLSGLSFLEKNKGRFPDTYERASRVCESSGIYAASGEGSSSSKPMEHFENLQQGSGAMYFLLKGIAVTNTTSR
jgi:hypothetical protein